MTKKIEMWKEAEKLLKTAKKIYIFAHQSLDGDALGAQTALVLALRKAGFENAFACVGEHPDPKIGYMLPPSEMMFYADETNLCGTKDDVAIAVDCANMGRMTGESRRIAEGCGKIIKIDHHLECENSDFADVDMTDSTWAATCEGLYEIIKKYVCDIDYEIGIRLYSGILTDTGRLTYSSTTGNTLRAVAEIVDVIGSNTWVSEQNFDNKPFTTLQLQAIAFGKTELYAGGKLAVCMLTKEDYKEANAEICESSAIVAEILKIDGVCMSIFMRPLDLTDGCNELRLSMRSREPHNVGEICKIFGGGGHKCASGATMYGDARENIEKVIAEAIKTLS